MAVQHGYGKMAGANSLVFAYDTGDTRNSYKGEPTENLVNTNSNVYTLGNTNFPIAPPVKEVFNGSTQNGMSWTDHLRWYNETIPSGTTITISGWYMVYNTNSATAWQTSARLIIYSSAGYGGTVCNPGAWNTWKYFEVTYTVPSDTTSFRLEDAGYDYHNTEDASNTTAYGCNYQLELKSHATPFVEGTRSATQGLLDLTGNSSIDLSNVSFDSDAMFQFDGTDDRIIFPPGSLPTIGTNDFTLEFVCKNTRTDRYNHFFSVQDQYHISFKSYNVDGLLYVYRTSGLSTTSSIPAYIPSRNNYYHIVAKRQGDNMQIYINGESQGLKTGWGDVSIDNNLYNSYIGWGAGTEYSGGHYAIAKIYNKALTDAEVSANFNHYKTRFNIS